MSKVVHVAAGVIRHPSGKILIAKRPDASHQGGLWEFPGGKVEVGESVSQALVRELTEELGIVATAMSPLIQIRHDYSDKSVLLDVWNVTAFSGDVHGREGQPVRWVVPSDLSNYQFPAANVSIVTAAQLPSRLLITGNEHTVEACRVKLAEALSRGIKLVQLRQQGWGFEQWSKAAPEFRAMCHHAGAKLMLNNPPENLACGAIDVDGFHFKSTALQAGVLPSRKPGQWLSAACHNAQDLERAEALGADFVTLSPVCETASHPGEPAMGWEQFKVLVERAKLPVFALGGMNDDTLDFAVECGAQGIAGIRYRWPV